MQHRSCDTKAGIWHIGSHFNDKYPLGTNILANGPQIVLTSPYRQDKEIRPYRKHCYDMFYLPLPSLEEMEDIRVALFGESEESRYFVSHEKMLDLVEEYGCNPWTIFSWKYHKKDNRRRLNEDIDRYTYNIDGILDVLTSSTGNTSDSITDGDILHIVPHSHQYFWKRHKTTSPDELENQYRNFHYQWASKAIQDKAFEAFIRKSDYRMELSLRRHSWCGHGREGEAGGLMVDVYIQKLMTETGVAALVRNLDTDKVKKITFKPCEYKVYRNYSEIDKSATVFNIPHTSLSTAIIGIIPSQGLVFAPARNWTIDRATLEVEELFNAGVFEHFFNIQKDTRSKVRLIWVNVATRDEDRKAYLKAIRAQAAPGYPLDRCLHGVQQMFMEVNLFRMCEYIFVRNRGKVADMTESKWDKFKECMIDCGGEIVGWGDNIRWRWNNLWRI